MIETSNQPGNLELYLLTLRNIIGCPEKDVSMLDLCCAEMTITKTLHFRESVHVDVVDWKTRPDNAKFIQSDALDFISKQPSDFFDVCLCSDGIEHLTKARGFDLLKEMSRISKRVAIIFTPDCEMGLYPESVDPDVHKSQWYPTELNDLGWDVHHFTRWHDVWNMGAFFAWIKK